MRRRLRRVMGLHAPDPGFTLVEVSVALMILTVTLLAMLGAGFSAMRASALSRTNTQAADLLNAEIERARGLDYAGVSNSLTDTGLSSDPAVNTSTTPWTYKGEPLDRRTSGAIAPHTRTVQATVVENVMYTIKRYVTVPAGTVNNLMGLPSVRRVSVVVSWQISRKSHTRTSSTLVTDTRRGLPLPHYRFDYVGTGTKSAGKWQITRAPGAQADFGLRLINLGARDAWNITSSVSGYTLYVDTNKDGIWSGDVLVEPLLTDSNGDGLADTGLIEPSAAPVYLVAARTIGVSESGSQDVTFSAASVAQPTVAAKTVTGTLNISTSPTPTSTPTPTPTSSSTSSTATCTPGTATLSGSPSSTPGTPPSSYSNTSLKLFNGNGSIDGDSVTQAVNVMGASSALAPGVCNYSTEQGAGLPGRAVSPAQGSRWEYGTTTATDDFKGTALATVWVQCLSGGSTQLTFKVGTRISNVEVTRGTATATAPSGCNSSTFVPVQASIDLGSAKFDVTASSADRLLLDVTTNQNVRVLYEAPGADSALVIPTR